MREECSSSANTCEESFLDDPHKKRQSDLVVIMNDDDQIRANDLRLKNCFVYVTVLVSFVLSADGNKR